MAAEMRKFQAQEALAPWDPTLERAGDGSGRRSGCGNSMSRNDGDDFGVRADKLVLIKFI